MSADRARPRRAAWIVAVTAAALGWLALAAAAGATPPDESEPAGPAPLEITFLANEGFLIGAAGSAVLIDAFVRDPYLHYSAVPESVLVSMRTGAPPFGDVVLALVSHAHADHHQAGVAREFLESRPGVALATSPQVMALTFPEGDAENRPDDRTVLPAPGESIVHEWDDVEVEFLGLPHGGQSRADVENLGHVITVGGRRVLHVGDADQDADLFAPLDLPARGLDVALVPYWYLRTKQGRSFLDEFIGADWYIACHIPPGEVAEVAARLGFRMPNLRVPGTPLESFRY